MPKQVKKSGLASRLSEVRDDIRYKAPEPPKGGGTLPAGVSGIAKLTRVDFDVMESGDYSGEQRFYCHGVCVQPKQFKDEDGNVHRTEGALVQPNKINLCDTVYNGEETPFADNWSKAENRMKLLGIPTEDMDNETIETDVVEYVQSNELFFRFRTWKAKDSDRVQVVVEGPAIGFDPSEVGGDDIQDGTKHEEDDVPVQKGKTEPVKPKIKKEEPAAKPATKTKTKASKPAPEPEPEVEPDDAPEAVDPKQMKVLGKKADGGDKVAQKELFQLAEARGIDTEPIENWAAVAMAIVEYDTAGPEEPEAEPEAEESEMEPEKGDVVSYEGEEVLVTAVNVKARKADVRNLTTKAVTKGVAWSELSSAE